MRKPISNTKEKEAKNSIAKKIHPSAGYGIECFKIGWYFTGDERRFQAKDKYNKGEYKYAYIYIQNYT